MAPAASRQVDPGLRRIVLLRHAEAEPEDAAGSDHGRRLTPEGEAQAARIGAELRGVQALPDAIVSSPASRALRTAQLAAQAAAGKVPVERDAALYEASAHDVLACLERHARSPTVWVVGHNPALQEAARLLGAVRGDWGLGKACAAVLEVRSWPLGDGAARLQRLLEP